MGDYANVKRRNISRLINWLITKNKSISAEPGGKHNIKIKYSFWKRPFPIPFKHSHVNKHTVKDLRDLLVSSEICTEEEFDQQIK